MGQSTANDAKDIILVVDGTSAAMSPYGGIGVYILRLIRGLSRSSWRDKFVVLVGDGCKHDIRHLCPGVRIETVKFPSTKEYTLKWLVLTSNALVKYAKTYFPAAIFHAAGYIHPTIQHQKAVSTYHDAIYLIYQEYTSVKHRLLTQLTYFINHRFIKSARLVLADSECTKRDLMHYLHMSGDTVEVLYCFVDLLASPNRIDSDQLRNLPTTGFWLYNGGFAKRKNVPGLLRAYLKARSAHELPILILTGDPNHGPEPKLTQGLINEIQDTYPGSINCVGYVDDSQMDALLAAASLLIYPSYYEGFGLPVIEAAQHGVPVLTTNRSSLPELVDNPASLFDPDNTEEFVNKLIQAAEEPAQFSIRLKPEFTEAAVIGRYQQLLASRFPEVLQRA